MNKRGFIGKIFFIISLIILLALVFIGYTIYQAYTLGKGIIMESNNLKKNSELFVESKNCSIIEDIDLNVIKIRQNAEKACRNPLINLILGKIKQIPYNCDDLSTLENQYSQEFNSIKSTCANESLRAGANLII